MSTILRRIRRLLHRESGPTAVEYALMLLVIVAALSAIELVGQATSNRFMDTSTMVEVTPTPRP